MKTSQIEIERLSPHPRNSRTHSREQINAIGRALREWGWTQPVVADENLVVLVGHGRVEAAKALGLTTVPVVVLKGLSDEKKRALLISDNRLAELGSSWDDGILGDELRYLLDNDFDLTLTAFDLPEIPPDPLAKPPPEADPEGIVTLPGDVWHMDRHRLACGNPGAQAVVLEAAPDLLVTQAGPHDVEALGAALGATEAPVAYVWHTPAIGALVARLLDAAGFEIRCQIIRDREKAGTGRYGLAHDPCWYAVRKGARANYLGGRTQSTLWKIPSTSRWLPIECWKRAIINHTTHSASVVIDPMAGAGSVFIAAHQIGRRAAGVEIEPVACDLAVRRWEHFTGREARHGGTGQTYRETAEVRGVPEAAGQDPPVAAPT